MMISYNDVNGPVFACYKNRSDRVGCMEMYKKSLGFTLARLSAVIFGMLFLIQFVSRTQTTQSFTCSKSSRFTSATTGRKRHNYAFTDPRFLYSNGRSAGKGVSMKLDEGNDGILGLPPEVYNLLKRLTETIMTNDGKLCDEKYFVDSCVNKTISEMVFVTASENDNSNSEENSRKISTIDTVKPSDDAMTIMELVELLQKVPDWSMMGVLVVKRDEGIIKSEKFSNKIDFLAALKDVKKEEVDNITIDHAEINSISFTKKKPWKQSLAYDFLSNLFPKEFPSLVSKEDLLKELEKKFQGCAGATSVKYYSDLVVCEPNVEAVAAFCPDPSKSQVIVIGGESGSGKTVFATRTIPQNLRLGNASIGVLYHSLDGKDTVAETAPSPMKLTLGILLQVMGSKYVDTYSFKCLSDANMMLNRSRNNKALRKFNEIWRDQFHDSLAINKWWGESGSPSHLTLDGLVIIIDEVGKDLMFAYGIVEMGRIILNDMCSLGRAKQCLLIIVGAGCDAFGQEDSSSPTFGTDPTKGAVVVMRYPKIETLAEKERVLKEEILGGAFSRVLADNTRMLMRGIVPIFTSTFLTDFYVKGECGLLERMTDRIEAGSCSGVMRFCYRVYVILNGLKDVDPGERTGIMIDLFQFMVKKELDSLVSDVWGFYVQDVINLLPPSSHEKKKVLFRLGLATETLPSSSAMKFLACNGQALPVVAGNGIAFEEVVRLHLNRLFQCAITNTTEQYELCCAWPPCASKESYEKCKNNTFQGEVVKAKRHETEIKKICKRIKFLEKKNESKALIDLKLHVVMHQKISNAQGPDIMVLCVEKNCAYLDLFQVKDRQSLPSRKDLVEWMYSLGLHVEYDENGTCQVLSPPKLSKPLYTSICMNTMVESLEDALKIPVSIRHRYLVIKQSCNDITDNQMVYFQPLITGHHVRIWTSNFLEPTFSAIPPK